MPCPAINDQVFLGSVLAHVDCQARTLGDAGYRALSQPESAGAAILLGTLTIFIALIGYRLLLGDRFGLRETVIAAVKVGVVLLLATSWPAVKTLLYDVVIQGPSEIAGEIGNAAAIPGLAGGLEDRLQLLDWQLDELDQRGSGAISTDMAGQTVTGAVRRIDNERDLSWLGLARLVFLGSTIGSIAFVRFAGGILLALAPIFAVFLLFDTTRGLFMGWLRGLMTSALGSLFVTIALGIQLALLEPWVASVVALRREEIATPSAPLQLLVLALVFAGAMMGLLFLALKVAQGLAERTGFGSTTQEVRTAPRLAAPARIAAAPQESSMQSQSLHTRSRALVIADALARSADSSAGRRSLSVTNTSPRGDVSMGSTAAMGVPLGQHGRRRTRSRVSSAMTRRNKT